MLSRTILQKGVAAHSRSLRCVNALQGRWQSTGADAGDVIGIDLGTTNSCVAIMVRRSRCE